MHIQIIISNDNDFSGKEKELRELNTNINYKDIDYFIGGVAPLINRGGMEMEEFSTIDIVRMLGIPRERLRRGDLHPRHL